MFFASLTAALTVASIVTSGNYHASIAGPYTEWNLSFDGPGFHLGTMTMSNVASPVQVGICLTTCTYDFSGRLASADAYTSMVLNGTSYGDRGRDQIVSFDLTFTGTPVTATAACGSNPCGRNDLATQWPSTPFTMTGIVTVRSLVDGSILLIEPISGSGFATAESHRIAPSDGISWSATTFTFSTPEPTGAVLAALGLLAVLLKKGLASS